MIPDNYDIYPTPGRSSASFTPTLLLEEPGGGRDAYQWLREHGKRMWSVTNTGVSIRENFAQLLILEATEMPSLVDIVKSERLSNFFRDGGILTKKDHPCDLDTTSIACTVLDHSTEDVKQSIMDEMLLFRNKDGVVQTYFDHTRPRTDHVVCVNVLAFFHLNGREADVTETLDWVHSVLANRTYVHGSLYYPYPNAILYFLSRFLTISISASRRLAHLFSERVQEALQVSADADPLALAMRVLAAGSIGIRDARGHEQLLRMQEEDGSWPTGFIYRYGKTGIQIGNKGLTTAMAASAIRTFRGLHA
ncbi:hypothetical protein C8Q74DRAFT_1426602 [Fomes fomentarius]|nr:hypothetical protein C8Q74DRAFT_1426602 [Fomes fomentarius]